MYRRAAREDCYADFHPYPDNRYPASLAKVMGDKAISRLPGEREGWVPRALYLPSPATPPRTVRRA